MSILPSGLKLRLVAAGFACATLMPVAASAEYALAPGDVLELTVVGVPDLHTKSTIDADGKAHFPLIAAVPAVGKSLDDLTLNVRNALVQRAYRQRIGDVDTFVVVRPEDVSLQIASYRPIYIRGDVAKPGEQAFLPGMTVRQAIALAGGFDVMRFRMGNPFLEASDLRSQYQMLWIDFAKQSAHVTALKAALDGVPLPDLSKTIRAPLSPNIVADIARTEVAVYKAEADSGVKDKLFLSNAIASAQAQLDTFTKPLAAARQEEQDEVGVRQQLGGLLERGVVARSRVSDQQRTLLDSTQRLLGYSGRVADLQNAISEYGHRIEIVDNARRKRLLDDLQATQTALEGTRVRIEAVQEKLLYTGAVRTQLVRGTGAAPVLSIVHAPAQPSKGGLVTEDTVLTAGDTVEVSLQAELLPGEATQ